MHSSDVVKGRPPLRVWELNSTSTRYDQLAAAPSDRTLHDMWSSWAAIALTVGVFTLLVFMAVLVSRRARKISFNAYLLFLMFPDIVFSICCGLTCLLNAINGEYWSRWMCNFQQFYCVFGIGANAWLNAVVTHQLHKMLRFSNRRRRYKPPTHKQVALQALAVYLYVSFLGAWGFIEREKFPYHTGAASGLACIPIEADKSSTIFFWLCFFPLFVGIPVIYVAWVCYDVLKRKLLPPTGKRRMLTVYFGRLILVFLVMWLPTFILLFIAGTWLPPWAHWAGGTWSHLQGAVSAGASLLKDDIMEAFKNFIFCRYEKYSGSSSLRLSSLSGSFRSFRRKSRASRTPTPGSSPEKVTEKDSQPMVSVDDTACTVPCASSGNDFEDPEDNPDGLKSHPHQEARDEANSPSFLEVSRNEDPEERPEEIQSHPREESQYEANSSLFLNVSGNGDCGDDDVERQ